jgi:ATP-dependent DNA helicase DinG
MDLNELLNEVKESEEELPAAPLTLIAQAHETLEKANELIGLFVKEASDNVAMWYTRNNLDIPNNASLFSARINVSYQMRDRLWERCHHAIVMSATLSTQGNFNQFFHESGLPSNITISEQYSSPFVDAFHNSSLHLYPNMADVDWRNETAHSLEIVNETREFMQYHRAGLLIFVSRRQMEEVVSLLPKDLKDIALVQQSSSKNQLIADHRKRIDEGKSSLLIGLASMSEGLDLKGGYLTFVGIAKLSFGASQSPRLQAESKLIDANGGSSFQMLTLPKAELALQQSVGRLIRSITDTGEVAIFDNRLIKKRYGSSLLSSLPPFYRVYNQGRQQGYQQNQ